MNQDPVSVSGSKIKNYNEAKILHPDLMNPHPKQSYRYVPTCGSRRTDQMSKYQYIYGFSASGFNESGSDTLIQVCTYLLIQMHWRGQQCCGSGSGIQDLVPFWPLDPGSGMGFFWIPDLGSQIPTPYFEELFDNYFGKNFYNSLKIGPNFFL